MLMHLYRCHSNGANKNPPAENGFPQDYENVVSVAAIDQNKDWASFSNRNEQVNISAPGGTFVRINCYEELCYAHYGLHCSAALNLHSSLGLSQLTFCLRNRRGLPPRPFCRGL